METHCILAKQIGENKFNAIYCHWGALWGSEAHIRERQKILTQYYNNDEKVDELLNLGELLCLDKDIEKCGTIRGKHPATTTFEEMLFLSSYYHCSSIYLFTKGEWGFYNKTQALFVKVNSILSRSINKEILGTYTQKYMLTEEKKIYDNCPNIVMYRIQALKDFTTTSGRQVHAGDLGGFIESEKNLSQQGNCWVFDNAIVFADGYVYENAEIRDNAKIIGGEVYGNAQVYENAQVCGRVFGKAKVHGNADVLNTGKVCGFSEVCGDEIIKYEKFTYELPKESK